MPIFSLIQTLGSKHGPYASFLGACSEIRQMKNTRSSLATMAQCILSEHCEGRSKCLEHYASNGIDRAVFHLSTQEDLEPFYIAVLPLFSEKYLRSEFWRTVWKYGKLNRVCKYYCERCAVYGIFNEELANYLMETSTFDPSVREALAVVCGMESYSKWLESMGFGFMVINRINSLVEAMSEDSIDLLNFSCYYENKSCADIMSHVVIRLKSTGVAMDAPGGTDMVVYTDSMPEDASETVIRLVPLSRQLEFLLRIFRDVGSGRVRSKVLEEGCCISRSRGREEGRVFANFIIECAKLDPGSVANSLCRPMANTWSPLDVSRYFLECGSVGPGMMGTGSAECPRTCSESTFAETLMEMCCGDADLVEACVGMLGTSRLRRRDASILDTVLYLRIADTRIFAFLYCADKMAFFNHFADIHSLVGEKTLNIVVADIAQKEK